MIREAVRLPPAGRTARLRAIVLTASPDRGAIYSPLPIGSLPGPISPVKGKFVDSKKLTFEFMACI